MEVIGVPFDLCGKRPGSRLGPAAVRLAGLAEQLTSVGLTVADGADIPVTLTCEEECGGLLNFNAAFDCVRSLKSRVAQALASGLVPLVIGGDHFISVGSISGALEVCGSGLAVLWIDAHADLNTPDTSPSGHLHGMPVAALLASPSGTEGIGDRQWRRVRDEIVPPAPLRSDRVAWFGLRELDLGEQERIGDLKGRLAITMHDVDRSGIVECIEQFDRWIRASSAKKLWISFDVDVLDPVLAPGTGTAVRGGLTYREMHVLGEILYEKLQNTGCPYELIGLDVVEINPLSDTNNVTALTTVEWVASLFGKRILGPK